jgi:hypothetical protein
MLSKEELLKPRIKILADWPGVAGIVKVGDVICVDDEFEDDLFWIGGEPYLMDKIRDYPHLFREMPWHEERRIEDLPEYVKCIKTPDQVHVAEAIYRVEWNTVWGYDSETLSPVVLSTNCYEPSTREEYEQYQQSK